MFLKYVFIEFSFRNWADLWADHSIIRINCRIIRSGRLVIPLCYKNSGRLFLYMSYLKKQWRSDAPEWTWYKILQPGFTTALLGIIALQSYKSVESVPLDFTMLSNMQRLNKKFYITIINFLEHFIVTIPMPFLYCKPKLS